MKKTTKISRHTIVVILSLLCSTSLLAQEGNDPKFQQSKPSDTSNTLLWQEAHISGFFSPAGPPSSPPKRIDAGGNCIVDLNQAYTVTGSLSGLFNIDYRIKVDGPCGTPSGTYDEDWIAHGTFSGKLNGEDTVASFTYVAHVSAGGRVIGKLVFEPGVVGELNVRGNLADGKLTYESVISERNSENMEYSDIAQQWFRGVYGSDPAVVNKLAAEDVIISYPIFHKLFGKSVLRGKEAVTDFASGFRQRWKEIEVTFHETVVQDSQVVLIWSFKGRNVGSARDDVKPSNEVHLWGGITLIRFDNCGKIVAEIGEESEPGPIMRLQTPGD